MLNKPYVGIILPSKIFNEFPNISNDLHCMFSLFEEAAEINNIRLCYFTLSRLQPHKRTLKAIVKRGDYYIQRKVPKPRVVYSRVLDHLPKYHKHIESLVKEGITIFNRPNYDVEKFTVHQMLEKNQFIKNYLPDSQLVTLQSLEKMMAHYDSLILKTNYGERGIGAMKLDRMRDMWCLSYKKIGSIDVKHEFFSHTFPKILRTRVNKRTYIVQETIPLATCYGNPFDMRVSVQKGGNGHFDMTAISCKVAKQNDYLTNGSQGASTLPLEDIYYDTNIQIPLTKLRENIRNVALSIANYMDQNFPHLGELGFDIGVTKDGTPYFIECNFINDYVGGLIVDGRLLAYEWGVIFTTPIDYAKYLLDRKQDQYSNI